MRTSMFGKFEREAVYHRETPARRLAVLLSILFLLSLSVVATATSVRARSGEPDGARASMILSTSTAR